MIPVPRTFTGESPLAPVILRTLTPLIAACYCYVLKGSDELNKRNHDSCSQNIYRGISFGTCDPTYSDSIAACYCYRLHLANQNLAGKVLCFWDCTPGVNRKYLQMAECMAKCNR